MVKTRAPVNPSLLLDLTRTCRVPRSKLLTLEEAAANSRKAQGPRLSDMLLLGETASSPSDSGVGACSSAEAGRARLDVSVP